MNYELRQASENDKEFLASLHKLCYRDVVEAQFGRWDDEIQRGFFEKKWNSSNYQIIILAGQAVGAVSVEHCADHFFLSEVQIQPDFQSRGLGSQIIKAVLANAAARSLPVRLQVLRKSKAKNLYLRLGFSQTGETDTHILMEKASQRIDLC
jgi:GNAT superfamily N-acetyltransferase